MRASYLFVLMLLFAIMAGVAAESHAAVGGTVLWQIRDSKAGVQMPTVPTGSAIDASGNIYITGYQNLVGGTSGEDFYTVKVTAAGVVDTTWGPKTYNEDNKDDRALSIAVDGDNNVVVVGNVTLDDNSKHLHILKYSGTDGSVLWEHTFVPTGPVHVSDTGVSLSVYGTNVYVTGVTRVFGSNNDDVLILKYDNSYSDGGSHPPVASVVFDRSGTQDVADSISAAAGGVAVGGRTWDGAEFDMLTLKYDLNLTDATKKVWQHSSPGGNSAGNNGSWGRFVKVDPDGNVIASGFDINSGSDKDIYTAKYCDNATPANCNGAAQGAQIWERRYQGSFADDVKGIFIDADKNVYITGVTSPISSNTDFYTARYNGIDGALVWETTTDGNSAIDMPNAIVVDDSGEVYVTGYAKQNGVDTIQTMKYQKNTATGRLLWQKTFKNPDNADLLDIRGTGIGLSSGGVVVSGWASKFSSPATASGVSSTGTLDTLQDTSKTWISSQYVNYYLKITAAGANNGQFRPIISNTPDTLTVSSAFPAAINAGDSYEIYSLDIDYYALKYEKGTLDRPTDLVASATSNSAVHLAWADNSTTETGFKLERCKGKGCDFSQLDTTITLGANVTSHDDTGLDPDTYYYYRIKAYTDTPVESSDYSNSIRGLTVFLNYSAPLAANVFTFDGTDHQEDTSPAVAVGPDNNPVVTGRSKTASEGFDYYTIKVDKSNMSLPDGILWSARYDAGQYDNDEGTCLTVDKDNKVIVSGDSVLPPLGGGTNMNVLMTVKYLNPPALDGLGDSTHSWSDQYNGPGKLDDHATAVATDVSGNFVVVGHGKKDEGNHQYIYAVKYNADNSRAWAGDLYDAGENGKPLAVVFGADGNIFVTGQQNAGSAGTPDFNYITIKYCGNSDPAKCDGKTPGQIIWSDLYDSGRGNDYGEAMAIDASNNIYVTGSAINTSGNQDFYTIKYDGAASTATKLWEGRGLSADGSESGEAMAAEIDIVSGDLLVAGTVLTDPGNHDFALIRYKSDGTLIKKKILYRPDNDDYVIGMALDASGNAFVAGNTGSGSNIASMTIQFDSDGNVIQSNIYNASTAHEDKTTNVAINSLNEAFVVGTTRKSSIDYLLYKLPVWPVQAPAPITITPGYATIDFSWPATSTASGVSYKGKRADGACSDSSAFGAEFAIPSNSYNGGVLPQNTTYCYAFKTTSASGDSRWVPVTATTSNPAAPTLSAGPTNSTQIDLSWTSGTTGQSSFEVWRCVDSTSTACSDFALLNTTSGTATGYSDLAVCAGSVYRYQVRAIGAGWSSAFSTTMGAIPPSVDNIFVDSGIETPDPMVAGQAVGWTYAMNYVVSEITFDTLIKHGGAQSLNINALTTASYEGIKEYVRFAPGGKYELSAWFKSAAPAGKVVCDSLDGSSFLIANSGTTSDWEQITQTLTVPAPSASSRIRCFVYQGYQGNIDDIQVKPIYDLTATAYSESQINLSWIDSVYDETGYEIWRCKDSGSACTNFALVDKVAANITTYSSTGLEPDETYRFQIKPYKTAAASCGGGWYGNFSNTSNPVQALYTKPTLTKTTPNTTQIDLSWVDTTSSESSFLLQRCTGGGCTFDAGHSLVENPRPWALDKGLTQTWSDTNVCTSTDYQYRIKPLNNGIQSGSGSWGKFAPLTVSNFKTDFITRVKILGNLAGYPGMKDDFSDIRLYDETAKKEIPYWIESKSDKNWAIVWFKTGSSNSINLYYENAAATSSSDMTAIFGSGVKAFFPFSEGSAASGTTYDKSGLGNNMSVSYLAPYGIADPGASKLSPDSGNVISADGTYYRNARLYTVNLPTGGTATIEAWIYPKSPQVNAYNSIASFGWDYTAQRLYLSMQDNGRPAMYGYNNDFVPTTGPQATFNAWNHIAVVLNGTTTATLYMNGQPVSGTLSGGLVPNLQSTQLYVGSDRDGIAFNGFIDDLRIYSRALTATDIGMRYASALPSVTVGAPASSTPFTLAWGGDDTYYSATLPVTMAAPVPPTALNAVANNEAKVTLTWTNKTSDQTGFKVFRCAGSGCSFAETPDYTIPNTAAINTTVTYIDTTGLVPGTLYKYKVQAYKTGVTCPWDSTADTAPTNNTVTMPLNAPTGLYKTYTISTVCKDLRFTGSDGSTILEHWLESGCNTTATRVWLKVPSLTVGSNTVYMHYANPGAMAPTQPTLHNSFFEFYDDFAGTTLDTSKWTPVLKNTSTITQNNGLTFNYGAGTWGDTGLYSNTSFARPFVLEFTHYRTARGQAMFGAVDKPGATPYTSLSYPNFAHAIYPYYQDYNALGYRILAYENNVNKGDSLKSLTAGVWNYYKLDVKTTGANYWHADSPTAAYTALTPTTASSGTASPLYIGMVQNEQNFLMSWVRVRKYASVEPTYTLLAAQNGSYSLTGGTWGLRTPITITNATAATLTDYQMLITPIDTTVLASDQIKIDWVNNTSSENGYTIERCDNTLHNSTCASSFIVDKSISFAGNGVTSYYDGDIKSNNAYCYRISATRTVTAPTWTSPASAIICETAHQQQAPVLTAAGTTTQIKLDWSETDFASESGAATATNVTTYLNNSAKSWATNQWTGFYLKMTNGTAGNIGVSKKITSNTNNKITVASAFPANIMTGDSYQIIPADGYGNMVTGIIGEHGYEVERCSGVCTPTASDKIATLSYNTKTYTDLLCSGNFTYRVHLVKYGSNGTPLTAAADAWPEYSNTVNAGITSAPVPTKVKATRASESGITLTWQDNTADETGFNIYRCKDVAGIACTDFALLYMFPTTTGSGTGATVTYNDTRNIAPDSTYRYQVMAVGTATSCPWESLAGTPDPNYTSGDARATTSNAAPDNFNVQAVNTTQVNVNINDNTASEGSIILERCSGAGCTDFVPLGNMSVTPPVKQNKVFYPFSNNLTDTSGSSLNLANTPVVTYSGRVPYFNDGLYFGSYGDESFQSPATGILATDNHAIEFDFKIRQYTAGSRGKLFGYTVATATPDKSSPGIYVAASGSNYGLVWIYLDSGGNPAEILIGVNGIGDASTAFTVNQWYHIRGEKSGNRFKVYVDGTLKGSTTVAYPQYSGSYPLTFGRDATNTYVARANLKNFSIDDNIQYTDTSECAGTTYSYRTRAVKDGFSASNVNIANFQANIPTRVIVPASIVAGRTVGQINDLRFYDYTAKADLPYWVESVLSDGTAVVWIKSANSTVTLYANKNAMGATSVSNLIGMFGSALVGYWPFDEAANSTTGLTKDVSGSDMSGTLTGFTAGSSIVSTGKYGNGLSLNGSAGNYVSVTDTGSSSLLDITGSMTLELWYNYPAANPAWTRLIAKGIYPNEPYMLMFDATGTKLSFLINSGATEYAASPSSPPLTLGWHHIVGRYDADSATKTLSIFIDGTEYQNILNPAKIIATNNDALAIGAMSNGTSPTNGTLDEVRLYNRALSNAEIASHYNVALPSGTVDTAVAFPAALSAWKASTPVLIAGFQPNYQTRLTVAKAPLMKNDFSDLRFYDTTAQAELPYWIESKTDGVSASLWLKTGNTNTIAMYYGNSGAASTAVAASTMFDVLFDDFTALDSGKWTKSDPGADITVDGSGSGTVRINGGALVSNSPVVSNPQNYAFEMKTYLVEPTNVWFTGLVLANANFLASSNGNGNALARVNFTTANALQGVAADGTAASNNLASPAFDNSAGYIGASKARIIGVGFPGSNPIRFYSRNPDTYIDTVPQVASNGTWNPTNSITDGYMFLGHVFGMGGAAIDTSDLVIDWVRVRKYAYPEPEASVNTGQFPALTPGSGGSGSWNAGLILNINNFQPNFPTMMTVNWRSGMNTDFSDIRFYDTTAKVELPYWIEKSTTGTSAIVWVKTGVNNTIAMYYGNNLATMAGNGAKVFEFFDDFNTLDSTIWSKSDLAADITLDGSGVGKVRINTGAIYSNLPLVSSPQNWIYEMKSQWVGPVVMYSQLTVSDQQYFTSGNAAANAYATNRLQNSGTLYAQAADGAAATNNVGSEAYPVAASPYSMAALGTDSIIGLEFQGDTSKISFFNKDAATYSELGRVSKDAVVTVYDPTKNWTGMFTYNGGYYMKINSGLNKGLTRPFGTTSYTSNAITIPPFPNFFSTGDEYEIYDNYYPDLVRSSGSVTSKWGSPFYLMLGSYLGSGKYTTGGGTADNTDLIVDWVRIRKYANPMPVVTMDAINVNQAPAPDIYQFLNNWATPYSPVVTVTTGQPANLAGNSDFENGLDKWTAGAGASADTSASASGIKSLKISTSLAANISEITSLPVSGLSAGGSYTLSGNIKANLTNGYAFCRLAVNNTTWDSPLAEYDLYAAPPFIWNKTNNSIPDNSNSSSTDGRIPLGISSGGQGLSTSPYGTPTNRGDSGSLLGSAVIKEDATHYKMWYSGNDHGTGGAWRIYYATSTDGINWTKGDTTLPSVQDAGVIPTGNKGWLPLGSDVAGIGDRLNVLASPAVIKDVAADGFTPLYKMWYTGHDRSYWRIYYATSPDGLNWTKYDNSVPAASDSTGTNGRIPLGTSAAGDKTAVYAPTVVKDTTTNPPTYKMWYSGYDGGYWRVYYAYSTDGGLTWTKQNNSIPAASDTTGTDGRIPLGNSASGKGDDFYAYWPQVIWEGGSNYKMWYSGRNLSGVNLPTPRIFQTFYATSNDGGLTWTKQNNAMGAASDGVTSNYQITNGSPLRGDSFGAIAPTVLKEGAGAYTMWYSGVTEGGSISIYRATTSNDGSSWTKTDNTIPPGSDVSGTSGRIPKGANATIADTMNAIFPSVIKEDDTHYKMWYTGHDGTSYRINYATSADGLAWNKLDNTVQGVLDTTGSSTNGRLGLGSVGKGDSYHVYTPNVIKESAGSYKMWYDGHDGINPRGIYLATSTNGLEWTKVNNDGFTVAQDTGAAPGGGRLFIGTESPSTIGDCRQLRLGDGSVLWEGGSNYKMWYTAFNGSNWRIYLATSSDGGLSWVKSDNSIPAASNTTGTNGRIPLGLAGSGDSNAAGFPSVVKEDATHYRMWYSGADGSGIWRIYHATSPDGFTWTKQDNAVPPATDGASNNGRLSVGNEGKGDVSHVQTLYVLKDGSTYKTWYTAYDQATLQRMRIFHASQGNSGANLNDNQWHSFSLPITLRTNQATTSLRVQCGISRDNSGVDGTDTANFDNIQLIPNNLAAFNLTATKVSESRIDLAWTDMTADESGYKIWRCKDPDQSTPCTDFGSTPYATVTAGTISYQDTLNLEPNSTYRYKVGAYKSTPGSCGGGWDSSYSNIASAKTDDASPASLAAKAINANQVDLSWIDKSLGESAFAIERSTDGTNFGSLPSTAPNATLAPADATVFSDMTACPATTYIYRVRALNSGLSLNGGYSDNCTAGYSWNRRKHLIISGFQPQYQTLLYVTNTTGMKADFSDLRFYDATAGKELFYWIESVNSLPAPSTARVWLKTGDNNNIDMYYGNTNASGPASGKDVFEFFEDFNGSAIDAIKWTTVNASGLSLSGGYLHGTNTSGQIKSISTFPVGKTVEIKAKAIKWADNPWYIGGLSAPAQYLGWVPYYTWWLGTATRGEDDGRGMYYIVGSWLAKLGLNGGMYNGVYNKTDFPSKSEVMSADNMLYRVSPKDAANSALGIDDLDRVDAQGKPIYLVNVPNTTITYSASSPIVIGGSVANPGDAMQVDWDWARVRKYAATEPTVTLDLEVSSSSLIPPLTCFSFSNQWGNDATKYYSNNSNPVTTIATNPPSSVTALELSPTSVNLSWQDNTGVEETGFEIQDCGAACADTAATPVAVAANSSKYSFTGLTSGTDHCYRVRAVKSGAICGWPTDYSAPACLTLSNNIHLDATALSSFAVKLDWDNVPADTRGFEVEKKLLNGNFVNIATLGNVLAYNDKMGISPLQKYTYRVRKVDTSEQMVFSDSFLGGINTQLWTPEVGQTWKTADTLSILNNNVMISDTVNGVAKLSAALGKLEFYSKSKGNTGLIYELLQLKDLAPIYGDFDIQLDYAITKAINSTTENTNVYTQLRHDTFAPTGYQYKIMLYRARIKDTDNVMKDAYVAQYTDVNPNIVYKYIFPTNDTSGKLRMAKTTTGDGKATISLYTSSDGAVTWDLRHAIELRSSMTMPSWLIVMQQLAQNELANTDMKAEISNIKLSVSTNANPYSNEATVTYTYPPEQGGTTINTTPAFTEGDGDCTCTLVGGVTVCTPGKAP